MNFIVENTPDASLRSVTLQELLNSICLIRGRNLGQGFPPCLHLTLPYEVDTVIELAFLEQLCAFDHLFILHRVKEFSHHVLGPVSEERNLLDSTDHCILHVLLLDLPLLTLGVMSGAVFTNTTLRPWIEGSLCHTQPIDAGIRKIN